MHIKNGEIKGEKKNLFDKRGNSYYEDRVQVAYLWEGRQNGAPTCFCFFSLLGGKEGTEQDQKES